MELCFFLLTMLVANVFWMVLVVNKFGKGEELGQRITTAFVLNTSEGLIKQGLLWAAILAPLLNGFALGFWAWKGHGPLFNPEGFAEFIKISLLPLGVMSISLPLAGLISRVHSTQQAAKQIQQAETQIEINSFKSNLDAFYAHRKGLVEYFSGLPEIDYFGRGKFDFKIHPVLHKRFFNGSPKHGWPSVNDDAFLVIESKLMLAAELLKPVLDMGRVSDPKALDFYLNSCSAIFVVAERLGIKKIYHDLVQEGITVKHEDGHVVSLGVTTADVLASIRFALEFFNNLCDYAGRVRMEVPCDLEVVFYQSELYLEKKSIEFLHSTPIYNLILDGLASVNENHHSNAV
ncbi:hypothetical protein [Pseudomonas syringae]|uniref:hypothetical protein n=1 Tax=Pseudomonas syringae TaxID=317 RepID=UPI0002098CD9|nr:MULTISPECIES: hypothetical protein [Pseudomonas syringae group]EGH99277.1 hypothetical protein PLA106_24538 [Pseudomonas amygdali pv. lachrymans str. M302278]KPC09892.1 Uncharacterized protein AC500_3387 [Pseudomonas amygdali pv. lachrymans]RMM05388.1 hypothetical protein ALQ85_04050 [Pseudomonas syringae]